VQARKKLPFSSQGFLSGFMYLEMLHIVFSILGLLHYFFNIHKSCSMSCMT